MADDDQPDSQRAGFRRNFGLQNYMFVFILDDLRQVFVGSRLSYEPDGGMARARSAAAQFHQVFGLQLRGRVFVFASGTKQEEVARGRNAQMIAVLQDQREAQSVEA